jgi:hypothetical protein
MGKFTFCQHWWKELGSVALSHLGFYSQQFLAIQKIGHPDMQ